MPMKASATVRMPRKPKVAEPVVILVRPSNLSMHEVEVEYKLPQDVSEVGAVVALPAWTPGSYLVRDYARFLDRVSAKDASGRMLSVTKLDKQRWKVPPANGRVVLSYRLFCNDLTVRTNHVDDAHAHLVGAACFVQLEGFSNRSYLVRFEGWSKDWSISTALPHKDGAFLAKDYDTLVDSPFELGGHRKHSWKQGDVRFELAITGEHCGDEQRILDGTRRIVEECGRIFDGFPFDRYVFLLTFSPGARGGLEHRDSTSLLADSFSLERPEGYHDLFTLIAHEFFHAWNVKRLRAQGLGPFDYQQETYTRLLWFHEGLTSFMQYSIVMKAGLVPWGWVVRKLSSGWTEYMQRAGRKEQSLEEASFDAWIRYYKPTEFSINSTVSYYEKGALVGWMMDAKIRKASGGKHGLDEFFHLLWNGFGDGSITDDDLREAFRHLTEEDPEGFWKTYIAGYHELDPRTIQDAYGLEFKRYAPWELLSAEDSKEVAALMRAKVYTGLSFASENTLIQNVAPGSPAALAGCSYGQEVLAVNGWRVGSATEIQKRMADPRKGHGVELLLVDRGKVRTCILKPIENPLRTVRIIANVQATRSQRSAFKAWTGQSLPISVKGRP